MSFSINFKVAGLESQYYTSNTRKALRTAVNAFLERNGRTPDDLEWCFVSVIESDDKSQIINWLEAESRFDWLKSIVSCETKEQ